jgi:hypothetical protein
MNINYYRPVVISGGHTPVAQRSAGADSTMPADFAVRYVWSGGLPNSILPSTMCLTIDTTTDEASVAGQRVRLGLQTADLERLLLAMRDGGTFARLSEVPGPGGSWREPAPSGISTIVRSAPPRHARAIRRREAAVDSAAARVQPVELAVRSA